MELQKHQRRFMLDEKYAKYIRDLAEEKDIPYTVMLRHIIKFYMNNHQE